MPVNATAVFTASNCCRHIELLLSVLNLVMPLVSLPTDKLGLKWCVPCPNSSVTLAAREVGWTRDMVGTESDSVYELHKMLSTAQAVTNPAPIVHRLCSMQLCAHLLVVAS